MLKAEFFVVDTNLKNNIRSSTKILNNFLNKKDIKIKDIKYGFDVYSWNERGKISGRHGVMILFE